MFSVDFKEYYREYYAYLFDHIDEFIALKDAIDATPEIYSHDGGGITSILGKEQFELRFGDLITLYANGQWCDRKKNVFLYKMLQFPPPGSMAVKVYCWDNEEKEFDIHPRGFPDSETLFEQARRVAQYKPQAGKKKIPLETQNRLTELFRPLKEYTHHAGNDFKCLGFARPINGQITEKNIKKGIETLSHNCWEGELDRVRYVLNNFPQIFEKAESKDLLLSAANDLSILRFLCDCGKTNVSDAPVILNACKSGNDVKERLDLLFELGADINIKGWKEEPAIVYAARRGNVDAVQWLVKHGADINARDKDGDTPLIVAAKFKDLETIRCVLQNGADVFLENKDGETVRDIVLKNKDVFDWEEIPALMKKIENYKNNGGMFMSKDDLINNFYRYLFHNLDEFIALRTEINADGAIYGIRLPRIYMLGERPDFGEYINLYADGLWCDPKREKFLLSACISPMTHIIYPNFYDRKEHEFCSWAEGLVGRQEIFSKRIEELQTVRRHRIYSPVDPKNVRQLNALIKPLKELSSLIDAFDERKKEQKEEDEKFRTIVDPNPDKNGVNALMRYCQAGDMGAMRLVWKHSREQFDAKTNKGLTPVNFATKHLRALQFLFKHDKTDFTGSPVASACEVKDDVGKRLDLLFSIGADVNAKNDDGEPPIVVAAEAFNIKAIRWLLKHGADKTATNANGETARDIVLKNKDVFDWKNILKSL
ncbi:MAG: ankyrin repeat domain-containing protein [Alphaproteobacteria bacterium]|nr:ankyrin repeat domain-containing protein [Alphaproteobacteria bacterium]